jgi:putative ABC transport system permease protein
MLTHYLVVASRALARHPFHAAVSVAGLALGLVCFVGAYAFAAYVNGADRQHPNAERIYVAFQKTVIPSMGLSLPFLPDTSLLLAERLKAEFPQLTATGRSRDRRDAIVTVGAERSFRGFWLADSEFMRIFGLPLAAGANGSAATAARRLLLTPATATALFGRTDVAGETVTVDGLGDIEIAGLLADLPDPSHLTGAPFGDGPEGIVVTRGDDPLWAPPADDPWRWAAGSTRTYVVLPPDGTLTARELNARMPEFIARNFRSSLDATVDYEFRNVSALVGQRFDELLWGALGLSFPDLLTLLGALVLGVACLNFANLATARAAARGKEVSLRKAIGAERSQVAAQHLTETALQTGAAAVIAVALLELGIAAVNNTFALSIPPPTAASLSFWLAVLAIVALVTIASGGYTAIVLSRAPPADALRSSTFRGGSSALRAALLTCQFAAASFLIVAVAVVAAQNAALRRANLALGADPLVVISPWLSDAGIDPELFRSRLLESPYVKEVTATGTAPWENVMGGTGFSRTPNDARSFVFTQQQSVSYGYFEALGTPLLAGRSFSREHADARSGDGAGIVIDRLAAAQFGWPNPADAIGQTLYESWVRQAVPKTIIGVVEHAPTRITGAQMSSAFVYRLDENGSSLPIVKIASADVPAALAHIDSVWRSLAPAVPIKREFADERFARAYALFEHVNRAFTAIAAVAIAISALGLLGMAAYVVGRRRREIGIRKTQGADPRRLFGMLLGQFLRPVLAGNLVALPAAFVAARAYLGLFVQPVPLSPSPFVVSAATTLLVATAVVAYQVVRAVRVTPAVLLRQE